MVLCYDEFVLNNHQEKVIVVDNHKENVLLNTAEGGPAIALRKVQTTKNKIYCPSNYQMK